MKKINLLLFLLATSQHIFAQDAKLENIQTETGVRSPVVKVDGNLKEWNDSFKAYNKQTKLFYTLSNDDQSLFLVVRSTDSQNNNKIAAGGITFTINTDGKKKDKDAYAITFPVVARIQRGGPGGGFGGAAGGAGTGAGGFGGRQGGFGGFNRNGATDTAAVAARRKQTLAAAKEIKIFGFKDVTDTLISVYNEYGVKAAIGYDAAGNYTYELAIPLKMLNLVPGDKKEIAYQVKVNGLVLPDFGQRDGGGNAGGFGGGAAGGGGAPGGGGGPGGGAGGFGGGQGGRGFGGPGGPGGDMFAATDFWGKYTAIKK